MIINNVGLIAVNTKTRKVEVVGINGRDGEDTTKAELEAAYDRMVADPDNEVMTLILWEDNYQLSVWKDIADAWNELEINDDEDEDEEDEA